MSSNARRLGVLIAVAAPYLVLNRHRRDRVLGVPLDDRLPLVPAIAVPYLAFLPAYWLMMVDACRRDRNYRQLVSTATLVYGVSNVTYLVFQTHAPRPQSVPDTFGGGLMRFIYAKDEPYCDFPSLHASSAVTFAMYYRSLRSPAQGPAAGFALTVVLATLLTKQHTIVGTLGGVVLAPLAWLLVERSLRRAS